MFQNKVIAELKTQLLLKDQRIRELEERENSLLDRLMAKDYSDYNASQIQTEDTAETVEEDEYEDLDPNNPPE